MTVAQKKRLVADIQAAVVAGRLTDEEAAQILTTLGLATAEGTLTIANKGLAASFKSLMASIPVLGWIALGISVVIEAITLLSKPYMDFIADEDKNRTLAKAVDELSLSISGDSYDYKMDGAHFIESSKRIVALNNIIAKTSSDYKAVADKINILLEAEGSSERISDNPLLTDAPSEIYPDTKYKTLYQELYQLLNLYRGNRNNLKSYTADCKRDYNYMKEIAEKNTLDYNVALQRQNDGKETILSPKEILALNDFIYEGTWTNDNAVIDDVFKGGMAGFNYNATDEIQKVIEQLKQYKRLLQ